MDPLLWSNPGVAYLGNHDVATGMTTKQNCWQVLECGRELGGHLVEELGVCPVSLDLEYDGVNGGKGGGRFCWEVAGSFSRGERQGRFATSCVDCVLCPFLEQVAKDGGRALHPDP